MYFWKIDKLKKELLKHPLSESETFKYLVATVILSSLAMIPVPFLGNNIWDIYSSIIAGIITVFGVFYIYKCNGGASGSNFLQKSLCMGWVIGIRYFLLIMSPIMIVYIVICLYLGLPESTTLPDVVFLNIIYSLYFWLLGKHIKDIAKKS